MRIFAVILFVAVTAACTPVVSEEATMTSPDNAATTTAMEPTTEPQEEADTVAALPSEPTMTELTFAGNGDTFLAYIETAVQQRGASQDHRYVAFDGANGWRWQGEMVTFAEETLLFLQPAQSGGSVAFQFQSALPMDESTLTTLPLSIVASEQLLSPHPEVVSVAPRLTAAGEQTGTWSFNVTIRYPDSGWEDYADGWHVETEDGQILGTRVLLHPHVNEQPFTRSLGGVVIPNDLTTVYIRSHDLLSGYSPDRMAVSLAE